LRLWSARATDAFDLQVFNAGDYEQAVRNRVSAENLSKVLYPEDSTPQGKELRLAQQYFFASASVRDFIENTTPANFDLRKLPERVIFQLNDTHPVIAIPELMRVLIDEKHYDWEAAWEVTRKTFAYTCHTLMPEALEVWSVELMQRLLPRHMELIYEINARFLDEVRLQFPGDAGILMRMSIIQEHPQRSVRMAHLAVVGSQSVNGVAELHSQLLRDKVLSDFSRMSPEKFTNVTNGITPRRFMAIANPGLSALITSRIGSEWITDLDQLRKLEPFADDPAFRAEFAAVKLANKQHLADVLEARDGILIDTSSMYDVMVKRLHEYKRQTLKLLHIVTLYQRIKADPTTPIVPRTFIFGAKAAPGYAAAKQIIALIHAVSETLDNDADVAGRLKIAFPSNYNVTLAEDIVPAAELSEQISLAGKEASGTGNMKFALNGALTVGTLDGANVEIRDLVGGDNFFLFGLTEQEVSDAIDALASGDLSHGDYAVAAPVVHRLLAEDPFLVLADYREYIDAQDAVAKTYRNPDEWNRQAILNIARSGFFSSDRSIHDYLDRIWHASPA
jgi:starch phosphorylase